MAKKLNKENEKSNRIFNVDGDGTAVTTKPTNDPTYAEIQKKAYEIYEQKGGNSLDNWLEAEQICKNQK